MTVKQVMGYIGCSRKTVMKYKSEGKLSATKDDRGHLVFNEREVRKIVSEYDDNVDKNGITRHDKKNIPVPPPLNPPVKDVVTYLDENMDDPAMLNNYGKQVLMSATTRLKDMNIYELADAGVIHRYAIAIQMQNKYLNDLTDFDRLEDERMRVAFEQNIGYTPRSNMTIIKLYDMFSKQVQNYEKSLGLTPESMSKLNPPAKTVEDEMEGFLNG